MDNVRLFLWVGLIAMLWLNYSAYVSDHAPKQGPATTQPAPHEPESPPAIEGAPPAGSGAEQAQGNGGAAPAAELPPSRAPAAPIHIRTDVLDLLIDTHGGDIVRVDLPKYPLHKNQPNVPVRLLDYEPQDRWVYQTGLSSKDAPASPDHLANYRASSDAYSLGTDQDELVVELDWVNPDSMGASKIYTFRRGSYRIDLDMRLDNKSAMPWTGASYAQMVRLHTKVERHIGSIDSYSFKGPVLYNGDEYRRLKVEDLAKEPVTGTYTNGWFAGIQHHFVGAIVPPADQPVRYEASARDQQWRISAVTPVTTVAPGTAHDFPFTLFIGPKLQDQLSEIGDELWRTVDYGRLTFLARPLFSILSYIENLTGNWGWAIVICTMLIKLVFYKLTETSGRSMAKMRRLQPRIKALQERFKDDRQALSQAMMELYRKEKVNPAAGCLPLIIQMPFFFAFYWVLIESVEMRQAPFMLWISDLSSRDPYFVLPLLNGAAMFLQTRLNPPPPDPMQARVMQFMPIAMTAFFALFPSGLVLYWLTNTSLGILQQWRINKVVTKEAERAH
ncbi:MAG TPA: membrane protein insertase YidC [Gammaproteobacteria bacterium]|nr:membrane protein insertase YidC [Gammaproteobacteria bacterium]